MLTLAFPEHGVTEAFAAWPGLYSLPQNPRETLRVDVHRSSPSVKGWVRTAESVLSETVKGRDSHRRKQGRSQRCLSTHELLYQTKCPLRTVRHGTGLGESYMMFFMVRNVQ